VRQVKNTVCDFCLNGCHLGVSFDGYQYRIEYLTDTPPNNGRLCPRGNSANIVIDHPRRLSYPLLDGKEITWARAWETINNWRSQCGPDEIAVVYSRGLTDEELGLVRTFAQELGTQNLACGYLEPDNGFAYRLASVRRAQLNDLASAQVILLVGDVFNKSPVAVKPILEARYVDKNNRLVVIDSIRTKQSGFAHIFLMVNPGTEYLALAGIAGVLDKGLKIDVARCVQGCGVAEESLVDVAKLIANAERGVVGAGTGMGRVYNPVVFSLTAQLVALKANKPFVGFGEAMLPEGNISFRDLVSKITENRIKMIFWFGGLYPLSYPEVMPELSRVPFRVATSIFRFKWNLPGLLLPVPSEFEKESAGESLWEKVLRRRVAEPVSGSLLISEIVQRIVNKSLTGVRVKAEREFKVEELVEMIGTQGDCLASLAMTEKKGEDGYLLVGERRAIGLGEFFDSEDEVIINPIDAKKIGVQGGEMVIVKSRTAEQSFLVKISEVVRRGVVLIGVDAHKNRRLFAVEFDEPGGIAKIPPSRVEIWRS